MEFKLIVDETVFHDGSKSYTGRIRYKKKYFWRTLKWGYDEFSVTHSADSINDLYEWFVGYISRNPVVDHKTYGKYEYKLAELKE